MMISDYDIQSLMLLATTLMLGIACLSIARLERRCRRIETFWASPTGAALNDTETAEHTESFARLEMQLQELQQTVMAARSAPLTDRLQSSALLPIDNARKMAERGASIGELTRRCGVSKAEAELLKRLQDRKLRVVGEENQ